MDMNSVILPRVATLLPTYQCNAECENCCFSSNPRIKKRLSMQAIRNYINQLAELGTVGVLVISGGECFLLKDDLVEAVSLAKSKGLLVRVVSNGYWAKNIEKGREILGKLVEAGLDEINISTGDKHAKFVSLETVKNAIVLSIEFNLTVVSVVELHKERVVTAADITQDEQIQNAAKGYDKFKVIESPWMPMSLGVDAPQELGIMLNAESLPFKNGCHDILDTIVLTPDGNLGHCCGLPREKIEELNSSWDEQSAESIKKAVQKAGNDLFKMWLYVDGPENMLAWAASKNDAIKWENKYSHRCHACHAVFKDAQIRNTLVDLAHEMKDEIILKYSIAANRRTTQKKFITDNRNRIMHIGA